MRARWFAALLPVLGIAFVDSASSSCASPPDSSRFTAVLTPDYAIYRDNVDTYLQRRCGTLDCHGQPGRAYRLYGFTGFRLYNQDAGLISGVQPTTPEELRANFEALVTLEPEEMSRVVAKQGGDKQDLERLLFIRKAQRIERHKGGQAMAEDDPGYRCVAAWLRIPVVTPPRAEGATFGDIIPPDQRAKLTPRQIQDCQEAAAFP
jgi:hypothetical protein